MIEATRDATTPPSALGADRFLAESRGVVVENSPISPRSRHGAWVEALSDLRRSQRIKTPT
jgi:hypothetical protein